MYYYYRTETVNDSHTAKATTGVSVGAGDRFATD